MFSHFFDANTRQKAIKTLSNSPRPKLPDQILPHIFVKKSLSRLAIARGCRQIPLVAFNHHPTGN
jgi:hypothetical protein